MWRMLTSDDFGIVWFNAEWTRFEDRCGVTYGFDVEAFC